MRFLFPIAALLMTGCRPAATEMESEAWTERPCRYARCFQLLQRGEERRVIIFGSASRSDTLDVISIPASSTAPPLQRIGLLSTTHVPFIAALGMEDHVAAGAFIDRARNARITERLAMGKVLEVATADGIDRERLTQARVDAIFDYPFGRSQVRSTLPGARFIPVTEYLEEHPLGRAEWLRFFGALMGAEQLADSLFDAIEQRYGAEAGKNAADGSGPVVFFGSAWQGQWHVPPGNSYMAHLIHDAGGRYAFADRSGDANIGLDLETVSAAARKADRFGVILAHGGAVTRLDMTGDARLAELPVLRKGAFYLDSERSDVFGMALLEPDALLRELACVLRSDTCSCNRHAYVFRPVQ